MNSFCARSREVSRGKSSILRTIRIEETVVIAYHIYSGKEGEREGRIRMKSLEASRSARPELKSKQRESVPELSR